MMFNFQVNQNLFYALARPSQAVDQSDKEDRAAAGYRQWGIFLRNHDELDLGRLTRDSGKPCSRPSAPTRRSAL